MQFGVRDICDVVFKAKSEMSIGTYTFVKGQPVLYIDTATASTLEQATTTVYAQGGKGNSRLITWEGEKTLTFTVTDALLSPISFAMLSGSGVFKGSTTTTTVHVHSTASVKADSSGVIDLSAVLTSDEVVDSTAPLFISLLDSNGDLTGTIYQGATVSSNKITCTAAKDQKVFVDFYVSKAASKVNELQITADSFGGNFYVEASTLFRSREDGTDLPAEITIPNVKIQSNFTFSMAATGDPSTFDFTMDAMPDYTYFDTSKKVMCVIQIVDDTINATSSIDSVMKHSTEEQYVYVDNNDVDSTATTTTKTTS